MKTEIGRPYKVNRQNSSKSIPIERKGSYSENRSKEMRIFFDESQRKEGLKKNLEEKQKNLKSIEKEIGYTFLLFNFDEKKKKFTIIFPNLLSLKFLIHFQFKINTIAI